MSKSAGLKLEFRDDYRTGQLVAQNRGVHVEVFIDRPEARGGLAHL